ncbi:MAG: DUF6089 family protein [Psychroflexus sp.]|nr:DUF6089 family protein [Psychroflexus sp.]
MRLSILTLFILASTFVSAQTYEAGLVLGGTNFVGDVGSSSFVKPGDYANKDKVSFGAIFKWNRSPRHAFRFSIIQHRTFGNDKLSESIGRKERGYRFKNSITEFSAGLEFNFWEWNLHDFKRPQVVPYISTGLNFFIADHMVPNQPEKEFIKDGKNYNFAIPLIFGVKGAISERFVLAVEFGARYTFTDNLDGSNPQEAMDIEDSIKFGNQNMNDWYIFGGLTLTYTFGRKPCYCKF